MHFKYLYLFFPLSKILLVLAYFDLKNSYFLTFYFGKQVVYISKHAQNIARSKKIACSIFAI